MLDKENGLWLFTVLLVTSSAVWHTAYCEDETVSTLRGQSVVLTCPIDITSCGDLHSVKWFKGNERVAVVSGDGDVSNVEGQFTGRMTISHNPKGPLTKLNLKSVQVTDEDKYLCETTFIEPMESCDNTGSYSILLKVNVPPSSIQIVDESNNPIKNATTLGPLREGHRFSTICEVRATRPVPLVGWYRAGKRLTDSVTTSELNGLYSVKSVLSLELSRQELGANIECRVETPALENIVSNNIHIDLQVRPTKVDLSGVKDHTVQGSNILLQCLVVGARPAANVTWYNNTERLDPDENQDKRTITTRTDFKNDGTFETLSQLIFAATRFENGVQIRCEADNVVMRDDLDKPLHDTLSLEVMYPPVVNVKPENITVNETGEFLLFCEYEANPASLKSVRWLRNGEPVDVNQGRIEGGNTEQTALLIKEASRDDIGSYTCELKNDYGIGVSENDIDVDVYYVPIVELTKEPTKPIIEKDESNVTLYCNVVKGNPSTLLKVRWFLDGQMLKELPECQEGTGDDDDSLCGVNPNVLLLENVGREFLGNYSCEGLNAAGWGQRSKENELMIYYQPGNATLIHHPLIATKKKSVTFQCSVEDGGNPNATRYRWLRGGSPVMDIVTSVWTVDPVGLDSRTNFSCYAYNEGGDGNPATIDLDVHVPQAFIQKLHPYTGALYNIPGIMLTCRVECVPECTINWFKDGVGIDESNDRYYINETYLRAEPATGDFESVLSELHFNMSAWPDQKLDIYKDNANYSCSSTSKTDGPGVRSATYIGVEYPPENTTITNSTINVEEGLQPPRVSCSAKAYPEPYYEWRRKDVTIAKGSVLYIFRNMTKEDDGDYHCISFNKHGNHSAVTRMNVLYKPNCTIDRKEINDEDTLVCTAIGNPTEMDFEWSVKSDNETTGLQEVRNSDSGGSPASFLILNNDFTVQRTYRCVANNSVGVGTFCEIEVAGHLMWWQRLDKVTLYILLGLVAALLLTVIIVCIIIICICRKRRRQDKYHTDLSISATQSVLSVPTTPPPRPPPPEIPKSPPKWPLRPGVMVHVKSDTKLSASRTQSPASIAANNSSNQHNVSYASPILSQSLRSTSQPPVANVSSNREVAIDLSPKSPPILPSRNLLNKFQTKTTVPDNGTETRECSADGIADHNGSTAANNTNDELINFTSSSLIERILGRLRWRRERTKRNDVDGETDDGMTKGNKRAVNLIRGATGWFGSGKSTNSSTGLFDKRHQFSGITCSDGVVTYKRTPVAVRPIVSEDANTNNNNSNESRKRKVNANVNDKSSAAGDPLTDPGEYENLPFHGMQSAPNKFYTNAKSTNSNVVRVAPRPKNNPSTYNYNLANSFPSQFSSNFYPTNSNYPNYPTNSTSYSTNNYPSEMLPPPATVTGTTGSSMLPFNPFLVKNAKSDRKSNVVEKKFNSLKSIGIKKSPQFYSMRVNKCRRHHSLANEPQQLLIVNNNHSMPYLPQNSKLKNFDQPLYENLTDSIQIHESSMQNDSSFAYIGDEFNCKPERNSIYRSDSGISNSSYECITPVPAPRTNQRKCQSAPVYMNLPNSSSHHKHKHGRGSGASKGKSNCYGSSSGSHHQSKHSNKCKNNLSNGGALSNYEQTQTNPFVTSTRRQQILVPKELFPINQSNHQKSINTEPNTQSSSSLSRRPVKLPLRKHHSFHFQPSQTVAGAKHNKKHYKNNGPLVFKPFNENSAFKPITPVPKSPSKLTSNCSSNILTAPRICGTSLKRHMSNVETFQTNRNDEQNFLTDDEDSPTSPSSSSASTTRGKRLHYADLAPLNGGPSKSCSSGSGTASSASSGGGGVCDNVNSVDDEMKLKNYNQNGSVPKRTTQYATLKFNEPLSADDLDDDMEYADVDYRSYGPINYKAASIYALVKKNKNGNLQPHRK